MSIKQRIKEICEIEKISIAAFEKSIEVSNGYVNSISKSVGLDKLLKILEVYPHISMNWLILGEGTIKKTPADILGINEDVIVNYLINNFDSLLEDRNFKIWYENLYAKARYEVMKESLGTTVIGKPKKADSKEGN